MVSPDVYMLCEELLPSMWAWKQLHGTEVIATTVYLQAPKEVFAL